MCAVAALTALHRAQRGARHIHRGAGTSAHAAGGGPRSSSMSHLRRDARRGRRAGTSYAQVLAERGEPFPGEEPGGGQAALRPPSRRRGRRTASRLKYYRGGVEVTIKPTTRGDPGDRRGRASDRPRILGPRVPGARGVARSRGRRARGEDGDIDRSTPRNFVRQFPLWGHLDRPRGARRDHVGVVHIPSPAISTRRPGAGAFLQRRAHQVSAGSVFRAFSCTRVVGTSARPGVEGVHAPRRTRPRAAGASGTTPG